MSRVSLRDMKALLERATYGDSYGIDGSDFVACRICERDSAGFIGEEFGWHTKDCPVPRLWRKYEVRGQRPKGERDAQE